MISTMHQRPRFLIAPNATFDRITGYHPGEACATRDLVADLYKALHNRGLPLMLYGTGDGPASAIRPDGPNQKGSQMAVAELEVYE